MSSVLVTGGAGYIGSNICLILLQQGYNVIVVDNFSNSKKVHIDSLIDKFKGQIKLYDFDLLDTNKLDELFSNEQIDAIIHMAGKKYVGESFILKDEYYRQNVVMTKQLLEIMAKHHIQKLVFSSSITVYGNPIHIPVDENEDKNPLSPYAQNKAEC